MSVRTLARKWHKKFNANAADLYPDVSYTLQRCTELAEMAVEIRRTVEHRDELIAAHYYARPEIQEVADFVGDSLGLGLMARDALSDGISAVHLAAVHFMGDTMKIILGDDARIFMPIFAGCSLVAALQRVPFDHTRDKTEEISKKLLFPMASQHPVDAWLAHNPDGLVLSYMNSDVHAKSRSYAVFTSRNALNVLAHTMRENPGRRILVLPDQYLAQLVLRMAATEGISEIRPELVDIFDGLCHVHKQKIGPLALDEAMERYPDADLLIHPECGCAVDCLVRAQTGQIQGRRSFIKSTQGMISVAESPNSASRFIVATETGHIYTLRTKVPEKEFVPVTPRAVCEFMKATTMEDLHRLVVSTNRDPYEINIPASLCRQALSAINRMLSIS